MAIPQNQVGMYAYLEIAPEDGDDSPSSYASANLQNVELKVTRKVVEVGGQDDEADVNVATTYGWTITAKKGVVTEDFAVLWAAGVKYATITLKKPGSKSGGSVSRGAAYATGMVVLADISTAYNRGEGVFENLEMTGTGELVLLPAGGGGGGQQEE